jgi:hypothetical protein
MANLLEWLLPAPQAAPRTVQPGAMAVVEPAPLARAVWVEGPDGYRQDLAPPWPPLAFRPPGPGLYRVIQDLESGSQESLLVAGGYDPLEADLTPRAIDLPSAEGETSAPARGALAFWPWLAGVVLCLSLAEWWVDSRGH